MAYSDRDALRIYRDPLLPPQEKRRILQELEAGGPPPMADQRVAGPGGGETGWSVGNPEIMAGNAALEDDQARQEGAAEAERRIQDKPPETPGNWLMGKEAPAPAPTTPDAPPEPEADLNAPGPAQPQGPDAGQYRSSLNRAVIALNQPGGGHAPKPQERVREEVQFQHGVLSPEQSQAIGEAEAQRDEATLAKERAASSLAMQAEDARYKAEAAALEERKQLAELNARKNAKVQQLRQRQNQITEEIANADIKQPHLWSRDNFGENVLTMLSVALMAIGNKGGRSTANLEALANREADKQARWLKAKQGQADALGTIIERHYANFGDVDAAKKQTVVDILGKAELEVRRQALEAEKQGMGTVIPRLQELEGNLRIAREKAEAERNQLMDRVVSTSAAREMVRDRQQALTPPGAPPPAAPAAQPARVDMRTGEELDAADRARPKGTGAPAAKQARPELEKAFELQRAGQSDAAIAALPPGARNALRALFKARKADMGAGTTDADALDAAFQDLGMAGPQSAQLVPQAARDRLVTLGNGQRLFATNKEQQQYLQPRIARADGTVANLGKMLRLAKQYKGSGTIPPAVKSEIEQLGNAVMFELSLAQEQGTVREAELPMYKAMVGSAIADYLKDPRYDLEAGTREIHRIFSSTRNRLIQNLSPSWTGEGTPQRAREVGR